jgi:aldose 1-epimerase
MMHKPYVPPLKEEARVNKLRTTVMTRSLPLCACALLAATLLTVSTGCRKEQPAVSPALSVTQAPFGVTPDGDSITLFTLSDGKGMEAKLITYGATLVSLKVPDRNGLSEDITLGYDDIDGYVTGTSYIGASIGRYANRIAKARFTIDGVTYNVTKNDGVNHLHGGTKGFHKVVWDAQSFVTDDSVGVTFTYISPDGEEGFPGTLTVTNVFALRKDATLVNIMSATTDKKTHVTFTHHSYFNLTGDAKRDILDHELTIFADAFTPVDATLIPTGEIVPVSGTPMDFTTPATIGSRIADVDGGYDHNFVLNRKGSELTLAARMYEPQSGRVMEVLTNQPAIQLYSGNFLDGTITGKKGKTYPKYYAFCLEPEYYPDSPNQPAFPSTLLNPGETHENIMVFRFLTR